MQVNKGALSAMSKPSAAKIDLVRSSRLFHVLSAPEIETIAASPSVILNKNDQLFDAGEDAAAAYIVVSGEIGIDISAASGRALTVASYKRGEVFGELGLIDGAARSATAIAKSRSEILSVAKNAFITIVRRNPDFAMAMLTDLARKIRMTNSQVSDITFSPLSIRLAHLLIELAGADDGKMIQMTQTELADRLGASREKVNAHLQKLKKLSLIDVGRGRLTIRNVDGLTEVAKQR